VAGCLRLCVWRYRYRVPPHVPKREILCSEFCRGNCATWFYLSLQSLLFFARQASFRTLCFLAHQSYLQVRYLPMFRRGKISLLCRFPFCFGACYAPCCPFSTPLRRVCICDTHGIAGGSAQPVPSACFLANRDTTTSSARGWWRKSWPRRRQRKTPTFPWLGLTPATCEQFYILTYRPLESALAPPPTSQLTSPAYCRVVDGISLGTSQTINPHDSNDGFLWDSHRRFGWPRGQCWRFRRAALNHRRSVLLRPKVVAVTATTALRHVREHWSPKWQKLSQLLAVLRGVTSSLKLSGVLKALG